MTHEQRARAGMLSSISGLEDPSSFEEWKQRARAEAQPMTHEQRAREWMDTHANDITHAFQPGSTRIYSIVPEKALPSLAALLAEVEREARADERAACAKVADNEAALIHSVSFGKERHDYAEERARRIAAAIRARGGDAP